MDYNFYVVAIGSSAGGLTPLQEVISGLPADINAAIIVSQHLPANTPSGLDDILRRYTKLKVVTVHTIEYLEPGHVYVMAAGNYLTIKDNFISLTERPTDDKINRTIDTLFLTLANEVRNRAIGVILSGAGYDGIEGAKAIEHENGLVIVQDPATAQFPLMPKTLITNDYPDYILNPEDITRKIIEKAGSRQA